MLGTAADFEFWVFEVCSVSSFSVVSGDLTLTFLFLFALSSAFKIKSGNISTKVAKFPFLNTTFR